MNITELSKIMASCQRAIKILCYKPEGSLFGLIGANKMENKGGLANVLYGNYGMWYDLISNDVISCSTNLVPLYIVM